MTILDVRPDLGERIVHEVDCSLAVTDTYLSMAKQCVTILIERRQKTVFVAS
jgi:hypothetical protein